MSSYDPHSMNAMFAQVLARMDSQDKQLQRIELLQHAMKADTEQRVGALERWVSNVRGRVSVAAVVVSSGVAAAWQVGVALWRDRG